MRFSVLKIGAVVSLLGASMAGAQQQAAPVAGIVRDTEGVALPNAQVAIIGLDRVTTTNFEGRFRFDFVPPGRHELYTTLLGYAPVRTAITVPPEVGAELVVTMQPAAVRLSAIQVTATRFAADPLDVAQSTVELSGQALNRSLGASVAQTLAGEPGLAMRYNGPAANMPVVRGLTGDRVLVLQNGERVGDLAAPTPDHALTVDPLNAQSIEVVRGPAALLYGSNALGGVVNVITRDIPSSVPNHVEGQFAANGESVNPGGAVALNITAPLGRRVGLTGGFSTRDVGDVRQGGGEELHNSSARQHSGNVGLGFIGDRLSGGVSYQGNWMKYGIPSDEDEDEDHLGHHDIRIDGRRQQLTARTDIRFGQSRIPVVRLDATSQWYEHDELDEGEVETHFSLKTQTFNATARTAFGSPGAIGASGFFRQYSAEGDEALTPPADSRSVGLYAFQDFAIGKADGARVPHVHFGARYDLTTVESKQGEARFGPPQSRDFRNFSGSVGLIFPLGSILSLNANVARAFRAPTVEELFSNGFHAAAGTFDIGDPGLKPETNTGGEVVLRARGQRLSAQFSAYRSRIDNYIAVDIVGDTLVDAMTLPLNRYTQTDADMHGLEGTIEAEVVPGLVLGATGDMVRGELRDGTPLPFMPAARLGGLARWQRGPLSLEADYRHGFAQNRVPPAASDHDPAAIATDPYDLVNLSLGYNLIRGALYHTITLRVDNVFDEQYRDATSRIKRFAYNPGRNFSLVYRVLF